jgi:hypothetical protein
MEQPNADQKALRTLIAGRLVVGVAVRIHRAVSNRSSRAKSTPRCSDPAIGCEPT